MKCIIKTKNYYKEVQQAISDGINQGMEDAMKHGQEIALSNKRGNKDADSILYEISSENGVIKGRLYTNFDYAMFLEYGTGTKAELDHIGTTKTFLESGYRYWFLPKEVADARGKEFSPERLINIKGELFYIMYATQPYPFMRPTAFELENSVAEIFVKAIKERLK